MRRQRTTTPYPIGSPIDPNNAFKTRRELIEENHDLRHVLYMIYCNAIYIVETQTEMHPAHRELVQMIVDATKAYNVPENAT